MATDRWTSPGLHRAGAHVPRPVNDEPEPAWYDRCPTCGRGHETPLFHKWWVWLFSFLTILVLVMAFTPALPGVSK